MLLALQVKVGKVASFVGKIFVVRSSTRKTTLFYPTKITLYTVSKAHIHFSVVTTIKLALSRLVMSRNQHNVTELNIHYTRKEN